MTAFLRDWRVTVGTLRVSRPLRCVFEVSRSRKATPAKATVQLYNLTRTHQSQIEQAARAGVVIEAGYLGERGAETIFAGELKRAHSGAHAHSSAGGVGGAISGSTTTSGADMITHVDARDGGDAYRQARVSMAFEPGVAVATVVRMLAQSLGLGAGNLEQMIGDAQLVAGGTTYPEGTVISGQASREMTRILAGAGLRWSVQHGALQLLPRGGALTTVQAIRLTPSTGLIGSPAPGTRGHVKATCLLIPNLWPGRTIELESRRTTGRYVIDALKSRGDSHGADWHADLDLVPEGA